MANELVSEPMGEGYACLVDEVGAVGFLSSPTVRQVKPETGIRLDLGGKLNKLPDRYFGRFLLSPGQAGELVAELIVAAESLGARDVLMDELRAAIERGANE